MTLTNNQKFTGQETIKLAHITTVPTTFRFLQGQVAYMKAQGFELHAFSSPDEWFDELLVEPNEVSAYPVSLARRISPLVDLKCILELWRHFRRLRPQIVHAHTPKAGLLGMIAATLARVPVRIYHMRGLPHAAATGITRLILLWCERVSCFLAHQTICNSPSNREMAIAEGISPSGKIKVLASGGNGVDAEEKFNPAHVPESVRKETRVRYGIPESAQVLGYVGRIAYDKGMVELHDAWKNLREDFPNLHLIVAGYFDERDVIPSEIEETLRNDPRIALTGFVDNSEMPMLYATMDVLTLPTYREGLPNVALEAAAMMLPVVATRVIGCVDAVNDGETGTLVPAHDASALADAIRVYLETPELRSEHGSAGRQRILRDFRPEQIWEAQYQEYMRLWDKKFRRSEPDRLRQGRVLPVLSPKRLWKSAYKDRVRPWGERALQRISELWSKLGKVVRARVPADPRPKLLQKTRQRPDHRHGSLLRIRLPEQISLSKLGTPDRRRRMNTFLKRLFDVSVASVLLVLFSPFLALLALAIRVSLGAPIIFSQKRPGLLGEPFMIYKFRTMTDERDDTGNLLPDEQRLTSIGKFLRRTSLDELPELFNVLRGEMSLVGPRPLIMDYLNYYSAEQMRRHEAKPGITGWAQVNGRNLLTWEEKFTLDVWYVDNATIWIDVKILLQTAWKVLKQEGSTTSEYFRGSQHVTASDL